jgi:hypothetical protein
VPPTVADTGYVVVEGFVDVQLATALYLMFHLREHRGEGARDDQVPGASSFWGDSTLDALLVTLLPDVERAAGIPLIPTYCYGRLYRRGDALRRHLDRDEAEVVATVHLGYRGAAPAPIRLAAPGGGRVESITQRPGDALVFLGTRLEHWRDAFAGDDFGQLFLNYVRSDGPSRARALDGRTRQFPPLILDMISSRRSAG